MARPFTIWHCLKRYEYFESLYLGNRLKYRDNSKSGFNGMLFSTSWVGFDDKIFNLLFYTFYKKSQTREWNDLYKDLSTLVSDQNKLRSTFRNNKKISHILICNTISRTRGSLIPLPTNSRGSTKLRTLSGRLSPSRLLPVSLATRTYFEGRTTAR